MADIEYLTVSLTDKEIERIFRKIEPDPITECWIWTGAITRGYGYMRLRDRSERVHRVIYAWLIKPIPRGMANGESVVGHSCNRKSCCNPEHLEIVTQKGNVMYGNGPSSVNAKKKHCHNGHPLPDNPMRKNGSRFCVICDKAYKKEYSKQYRNGPHREEILRKQRERSRRRYKHNRPINPT